MGDKFLGKNIIGVDFSSGCYCGIRKCNNVLINKPTKLGGIMEEVEFLYSIWVLLVTILVGCGVYLAFMERQVWVVVMVSTILAIGYGHSLFDNKEETFMYNFIKTAKGQDL